MRYLGSDALAGLCRHRQHQHLCAVLRLRRRSGGAADNFAELRCRALRPCVPAAALQPDKLCSDGAAWTAAVVALPNGFIKLFMSPTAAVLAIAPEIMRIYAVSFLLLPNNVFSTYYFQAMLRPGTSVIISVSRGIVISGALIMLSAAHPRQQFRVVGNANSRSGNCGICHGVDSTGTESFPKALMLVRCKLTFPL